MNGRYEKEKRFDNRTKEKLKNLPDVVNEYYYSLIGSGSSFTTIDNYINYIQAFLKFTFPNGCKNNFYEKIRPLHINKYISSLRTREVNGKVERMSDSIRAVQWSALNSFFKFLVPEYIKENPVENTQRPKIKDNPNVTYLTQEEVQKIYANVEKTARVRDKNRDLCVLKIGFSTGLRVSAIVQINVEDIDFTNNTIKVVEKGDRDYYIMFGDNLKKQILIWLEDRKKQTHGNDSGALFISQMGSRLSADTVTRMIAKYSKPVTDKHVTPHVMRHSCATNLYEKTGDIYLCAKQLNHKNVTTTQRYAEISKEKQKQAATLLDDMF